MKVVVVAFEQCRGYAREAGIRPNEHHTPVLGEHSSPHLFFPNYLKFPANSGPVMAARSPARVKVRFYPLPGGVQRRMCSAILN